MVDWLTLLPFYFIQAFQMLEFDNMIVPSDVLYEKRVPLKDAKFAQVGDRQRAAACACPFPCAPVCSSRIR